MLVASSRFLGRYWKRFLRAPGGLVVTSSRFRLEAELTHSWEGLAGSWGSWRRSSLLERPGRFGPGRVLEAWGVDSVPEGLLRCFLQILQIAPPIFEEPVAVQPPLRVNSKRSRILRNLEPHKGNARPP